MRCRHLPILLTLAVGCFFALIGSPPSTAQAPAPVLDHFRCYTVVLTHDPDDDTVLLQDQFDVKLGITEDVWVGGARLFCNPVSKTVRARGGGLHTTPIEHPNDHLTMYRTAPRVVHPPQAWRVRISNQFGKQGLRVDAPHLLAVPTEKREAGSGFPEDLDHFKCYRAEGRKIDRPALLVDQFETNALVEVLEPRLFCNPTRKTDSAGNEFPVQFAGGHLTCYEIVLVAPGGQTDKEDLVIANQFTGGSTGDLEVVTDERLLCVPTRKIAFELVKRGDDDERGDD